MTEEEVHEAAFDAIVAVFSQMVADIPAPVMVAGIPSLAELPREDRVRISKAIDASRVEMNISWPDEVIFEDREQAPTLF